MSLRLYVGNYPCDFTRKDIEDLFGDFDGLKIDKICKKDMKCFSFLICKDIDQLVLVIQNMNDKKISGRKLRVRACDNSLQEYVDLLLQDTNEDLNSDSQHTPFVEENGSANCIQGSTSSDNYNSESTQCIALQVEKNKFTRNREYSYRQPYKQGGYAKQSDKQEYYERQNDKLKYHETHGDTWDQQDHYRKQKDKQRHHENQTDEQDYHGEHRDDLKHYEKQGYYERQNDKYHETHDDTWDQQDHYRKQKDKQRYRENQTDEQDYRGEHRDDWKHYEKQNDKHKYHEKPNGSWDFSKKQDHYWKQQDKQKQNDTWDYSEKQDHYRKQWDKQKHHEEQNNMWDYSENQTGKQEYFAKQNDARELSEKQNHYRKQRDKEEFYTDQHGYHSKNKGYHSRQNHDNSMAKNIPNSPARSSYSFGETESCVSRHSGSWSPTKSPSLQYNDSELIWVSVTNFPLGTSIKSIYELFIDFKPIKVKIICNEPRKDRTLTEAHVAFLSQEVADDAILTLDNTIFDGRIILVTDVDDLTIMNELLDVFHL